MQENLMILSECEEINSLLYKPIATTQRIKFTCLNVSINYIVLGSTSGSLYLFIREPCTFQQLIPLSEGPVSSVVISPDEKMIALATKRGSVCLIAVRPTVKLLAVSSEHLGEMITSLCWNDNSSEIYIGDGIGKISTMILSIFTVNGMFQAPACVLMHLDSTIVQMEFSGNLLLVSTMTRCYICDTGQEQFKQIGNKARDGEFGACFLANKSTDAEISPQSVRKGENISSRKGTFNLISDTNGDTRDDKGTKIYCARPGCRLWEVTTNGIVVKTHQFKDALAIPSCIVYRSNIIKPPSNRQIEPNWTSQVSINFSHLYALCGKYLFSHTCGGLYVIDPTNAAVILWNNEYANVAMARTIDDKIYLMTENGIFHCLRLTTSDTLIIDLYDNKRYSECLHACKTLKSDILKSTSGKNYHENDEREITKKSSSQQNDIMATLIPIISLIQSNINSHPIKLNSGIVVVNAGNGKIRGDEKRNFSNTSKDDEPDINDFRDTKIRNDDTVMIDDVDPVLFDNLAMKRRRSIPNDDNEITKDSRSCIDLMANVSINDNFEKVELSKENGNVSKENKFSADESNTREIDDVTSKIQKDLEPVYTLINSLKPSMSEDDIEEIIINVRKTMSDINENYGKINELKDFLYEILRSTERHYYNSFLENTTRDFLLKMKNETVASEIVRAFVDTNISCEAECTCGFLYPKDNPKEPKFLDIGKSLLEKFANDENRESCTKLCNNVTFMWRCYLPMCIEDFTVIDDILCMCLRTRDNIVLSTLLPMLDVRQWEIAVKCIRDMEMGICPCCNRRDESSSGPKKMSIDWSGVARELMKREGTSSAMTFLVLIETVLPNVSLDKSIFQSLIFTKILEHRGLEHVVDFDTSRPENSYEAMCSPKVQDPLTEALEKDLERPVENNIFGIGAHHWGIQFNAKSSACPCCTLSLKTPVLLGDNGISLFPCGHAYHVNCLIQRKLSKCNLHS